MSFVIVYVVFVDVLYFVVVLRSGSTGISVCCVLVVLACVEVMSIVYFFVIV